MAITPIVEQMITKDKYSSILDVIVSLGVSVSEAADSLGRAAILFNRRGRPVIESEESTYSTVSTTDSVTTPQSNTLDNTSDPSLEDIDPDTYLPVYRLGYETTYIDVSSPYSVGEDSFFHSVETQSWLRSTPMEAEKLGEISRATGVGVRELLSLFTKVGDKCRVRRNIVEDNYFAIIESYAVDGLFNVTETRTPILMVRSKYNGFLPISDKELTGSTIEVKVKVKSSIIPKIRAIRIPGIKPKTVSSTFHWVFDIGVDGRDLIFPVFNTEDKVRLSEDGNYYKED